MSMIKIHNVETGEIVEREMNAHELAQQAKDFETNKKVAEAKAEAQAKREAALAKLASLGLDTEDLKALGL